MKHRFHLFTLTFVILSFLALTTHAQQSHSAESPSFSLDLRPSEYYPWPDAEVLPDGWKWLPWFGYFAEMGEGWIAHAEHGYQYVIGKTNGSILLYDMNMECWLWVSDAAYPWIYKFGTNAGWYWYYRDGTPGERWFNRLAYDADLREDEIDEEIPGGPAPAGFSYIPAGSFMMGDPFNEGDSVELPVHEVEVSGFYLQQTEVTNAQMAKVLNWAIGQALATASSGTVESSEGDGQELLDLNDGDSEISWDGSELVVNSGKENHPVVKVTWYGAMAYCHYRTRWEGGLTQAVDLSDWTLDLNATGYRLPTEAEWEKAARGGAVGERYPFGNSIDSTLANYNANEGGTVAVGSYPATGYGLYDMAGNVEEWCADWYGSDYYGSSGAAGPNPKGPASPVHRVRVERGGSLGNNARRCRSAYRYYLNPTYRYRDVGFRLALSPGR